MFLCGRYCIPVDNIMYLPKILSKSGNNVSQVSCVNSVKSKMLLVYKN